MVQSVGEYSIYALVTNPGSFPGGEWVAWISSLVLAAVFSVALTFLFLIFPDGRLPSRRWRSVAWLGVCVISISLISLAFAPGKLQTPFHFARNPAGIEEIGWMLKEISNASWPLYVVALYSLASLFSRFRHSKEQRQQIKWFAYAGVLSLFSLTVFPDALLFLWGDNVWTRALENAAVFLAFDVGLPVAIGIAVLKYRLYDIDLIINRTLVYGVLTASLAAVYAVCVVLFERLFYALTGETSQLTVVAATLVIAALFNPMRRYVQSFIDRRFYRKKYDVVKTLEDFSRTLRDELDLEKLTTEMLTVVEDALQPEHVSLWLRPLGWGQEYLPDASDVEVEPTPATGGAWS